jgi:dTDP-D-glucose 4,6-dehydratase
MFVQGDFGDRFLLDTLLVQLSPRAVLHFAAESYLDRPIHGSEDFTQTKNIRSFHLLEAVPRPSPASTDTCHEQKKCHDVFVKVRLLLTILLSYKDSSHGQRSTEIKQRV